MYQTVAKNIKRDIETMIGFKLYIHWWICWTFISPLLLLVSNVSYRLYYVHSFVDITSTHSSMVSNKRHTFIRKKKYKQILCCVHDFNDKGR